MTQFARPDGDTTIDKWSGNPFSPIFRNINESTSDNDSTQINAINSFAFSTSNPNYKFTLSSITSPPESTQSIGHFIFIKLANYSDPIAGSGSNILRIILKQGSTTKFTASVWVSKRFIGQSEDDIIWHPRSFVLPSANALNITDYTDLNMEIELFRGLGIDKIRVTMIFFGTPDFEAPPAFIFEHFAQGGVLFGGIATITDVTNDIIETVDGGIFFSGTAEIETSLILIDLFDIPYVITIEDTSRNTLGFLNGFSKALWTRESNKFSTLTITFAIDDLDIDEELADFPNILAIKNKQGVILDRLAIAKVSESDGFTTTRTIQAFGLFWLLSKTNISFFEKSSSVFLIVKELLETFQITNSPHPVSLGTIDSDIGDQIKDILIREVSITEALISLYKTTGGSIEVDGNGILNWKGFNFDTDTNLRISNETNLININRIQHHDLVRTRVIVQSEDEFGDKILVTATLAPGPILTKYGDVPEFIFDNSVKTITNAQELADSWLDRLSIVVTDIRATIIDNSKIDTINRPVLKPQLEFNLNDAIEVIHPRKGNIGIKLITKIVIDLANPGENKIELVDPISTDFRETSRNFNLITNLSDNTRGIKDIGVVE